MSDDERPSPRARISKWLLKANDEIDHTSARKHQTKLVNLKNEHRNRASLHSEQPTDPPGASRLAKYLANDNHDIASAHRQKRDLSQSRRLQVKIPSRVNGDQAEESTEISNPEDCGIAKRLGLQGPFQAFGDEAGPSFCKTGNFAKRRRKALSSSSDLQPAVLIDVDADLQENKASHNVMINRDSLDLSHDSDHSTLLFDPPKKGGDTYERRPRHKTREDRYEVQQPKERKKKVTTRTTEKAKPANRRRNRIKSGGVLMHDFNAPNVQNDRLTVINPLANIDHHIRLILASAKTRKVIWYLIWDFWTRESFFSGQEERL